ncbi:hypothetical protein [Streptomyces sp. NPDC046859]|uniref:hypothetical protein n=1 Tax=Streptomyces sp. NPDC046859 TaxID=3155734 RepID=UPI0033DBAC99
MELVARQFISGSGTLARNDAGHQQRVGAVVPQPEDGEHLDRAGQLDLRRGVGRIEAEAEDHTLHGVGQFRRLSFT